MNEWNRLSEISTSTRMYLAQGDVQSKNISSAAKLARIWRQNIRYSRAIASGQAPDPAYPRHSWEYDEQDDEEPAPPAVPGAIELPAGDVLAPPPRQRPSQRNNSRLTVDNSSRPQSEPQRPTSDYHQQSDDDRLIIHADEPYTYEPRRSNEAARMAHRHNNSDLAQGPIISVTPPPPRTGFAPPPPESHQSTEIPNNSRPAPAGPPPLPPKTPLAGHAQPVQGMKSSMSRPPAGIVLPYPDTDGPPPVVNVARKPEFGVR
jgi:hypothetical protein